MHSNSIHLFFDPFFRILRLFSLVIFLVIFLDSEKLSAEVLKAIEVTGNKRTLTSALIQHGQIKEGEDLNEEGLQTIKDHLGRINQFRLKSIDFKKGILRIDIEEKWTLFPVPMITESGNYHNRGFVLYEENFLGTLGTLALGISWSNSSLNGLFYFQDESLFSADTGIKLLLMKKNDYVEVTRSSQTRSIHESRSNLVMITPNYLYKNQVYKAGPVFLDKKIVNKDGLNIFSERSRGLFFRHHLNAFHALDILYEGMVTTYDLYVMNHGGSNLILRHEADLKWSTPISAHFLNLGLHGHHINNQSYSFPKYLGGDEGFRGYNKSSIPASRNIGFFIQYQHNLFNHLFVTPFYEFNSSQFIQAVQAVQEGKAFTDNTLGIGIRYYFKKISIPAVAFDYGRNLEDQSGHLHLTIGLNF